MKIGWLAALAVWADLVGAPSANAQTVDMLAAPSAVWRTARPNDQASLPLMEWASGYINGIESEFRVVASKQNPQMSIKTWISRNWNGVQT
jgi:hypothetical protein